MSAAYCKHLCVKDGTQVEGFDALSEVDKQVVLEWLAPPFQIQYRGLSGHHGTLDGVRSGDSARSVLYKIAAKLGVGKEAAARLRLVRAGKQLEPAAACALVKDETVHVIDGLGGGAPTLRPREVAPASGAALPAAPSVAFYQGGAHGGRRLAELTWMGWMSVDRGAFADTWVSAAERRRMPAHLGVIVTYIDESGEWHPTTVVTESATQPGQWGYYCAHRFSGGECMGAMLDTSAPDGPSRYLVALRSGLRDGATSRPGGPTRANDPRGTGLPANAWCYDHGWLAVKPFGEIAPLRPDLSPHERRRREVLWDYGDRYWEQHERALARLPPVVAGAMFAGGQLHEPAPSPPSSPPGAEPQAEAPPVQAASQLQHGHSQVARDDGDGPEAARGDSDGAVHCRNADTLARLHPFDNDVHLTFDEASHQYTAWGQRVQRSCTALIASFFDGFDPEGVIADHFERWKGDPAASAYASIARTLAAGGSDADAAARIRGEWAERGAVASRLGTALHHYIECELNGTPIPPPADLETEIAQWHCWRQSAVMREYGLMPQS